MQVDSDFLTHYKASLLHLKILDVSLKDSYRLTKFAQKLVIAMCENYLAFLYRFRLEPAQTQKFMTDHHQQIQIYSFGWGF